MPNNDIIYVRGGYIKTKANGETISLDTSPNLDPVVVTGGSGGIVYAAPPETVATEPYDDDFEPLFTLLENLFASATRNYGCENSNHRRGWIFNGIVPEFAECGCYITSWWPAAFGVVAGGVVSVAKKTIIKKTRRVLFKKFLEKLQSTVQAKRFLRISWLGAKKVGVDPLATVAEQAFTLPPVAPGFTRYYRAQGNKGLSELANDADPKGAGRWFSNSLDYILQYIDKEIVIYPTSFRGKYPNGHIVYVDLPTGSVSHIIDDTRYALLNNVQAFDPETGQYVISSQDRLHRWWDTFNNRAQRKLPVKRKNNTGGIDIIFDVPNSSDIALNPGIFVGYDGAGFDLFPDAQEFFLDPTLANQAKKIAACDNLADIDEFDKAFEKLDQFAWCEGDNGDKVLSFRVVTNSEYNVLGNSSTLARGIDLRSKNVQRAEQLLTDEGYRNAKFSEFDAIIEEFEKLRRDHLDETPPTISNMIDELKDLIGPESQIRNLIDRSAQIFAFIEVMLNAFEVVETKKCHPDLFNIQSIPQDTFDDITNSNLTQLEKLELAAVMKKLPVFSRLNSETCKCEVCPDGYSLCSKEGIFNLWDDRYNTCFPECCGNRELSPPQIRECTCQCTEDQEFLPCDSSDCFSHTNPPSYLATWFNGQVTESPFALKPFRGACFDKNPNPDKLQWNQLTCSYECMDYELITPPRPPITWVGGGGAGGVPPYIKIKKKYEPCPDGQIRLAPDCRCGDPEPSVSPSPSISPEPSAPPPEPSAPPPEPSDNSEPTPSTS